MLTVIIATTSLGGGEEATGFLNAGIGLGGFIGALVAGALVLRPSLVPLLVGGSLVSRSGWRRSAIAPALGVAIAAITVAAAGSLVIEVTSTTIFQRVVPDAIRGRALGVLGTVSTVAFAAGSFLIPVAGRRRRDRPGHGRVRRRRRGGRRSSARLMAASAARRTAGSDGRRPREPAGRPAALRGRTGSGPRSNGGAHGAGAGRRRRGRDPRGRRGRPLLPDRRGIVRRDAAGGQRVRQRRAPARGSRAPADDGARARSSARSACCAGSRGRRP